MARTSTAAQKQPAPKSALQWVVQILGELLITAGLILLLFVAWQLWWTNIAANNTQAAAVDSLSREFDQATPQEIIEWDPANPVSTLEDPAHGQAFGIIYIPKLGNDYQRPLAQDTTSDVIDTLGLGHYDETALPGQVGNFSVAGHRQTRGAVLDYIDQLETGDKIYVRTKDGYYIYSVYSHEIVTPDRVDVIDPVPGQPGVAPTERLMTLTTCHPRYGDTERYIVHARFESWRPAAAGAPEPIAHLTTK
ncbi:MAG: class E sortase [Rothia sp. (in: high G+C Gram-positive bacteria)]|uniref:class E sortase n=1 Tax=Rothia sp. (in: high G+C Gram-positive bacteria) TaxID=1885016 RepID=UPI0026DEF9DF|nr:class E sortase [Rothia sp. (in: high G+C Gram-positive bacteria)]MDO5750426.1 class E sortase [Rothia sp. (in: high G+C Gram-positive bacteria)]